MLGRPVTIVAALLALLSLGACQSPRFTAQVTQFHKLAEVAPERSFMLLAHEEAKMDSLEFAAYADQVVGRLTEQGYTQADRVEDSDLVVFLGYKVGTGRVESHPVPVYGHYSSRFSTVRGVTRKGERFSAHIHESGGFEPLGYAQAQRTTFKHRLDLDIVAAPQWREGRTLKLYEGRVETISGDDMLARTVPRMIEALFVAFPGASGETREIVLEPLPQG
jgi:hypothetical protein